MNERKGVQWGRHIGLHGKTILCLTTLFHRRFIDDAIQIVGLPTGARIRLRYRRRYVSPSVWELPTSRSASELHALIVLGGTNAQEKDVYEPLRAGRVSAIEVAGEMLILEVCLGGFLPDRYGGAVWSQVASIAARLPPSLSGNEAKNGHYLQLLKSPPTNAVVDDSVEAWELVTDAFFRVDSASRVPFLFLMRDPQSGPLRKLSETGELRVESGTGMSWDIHTKSAPAKSGIFEPLGEVLVDVSCPSIRMVTSKRARVDSQRDMRRMRLACDAGFRVLRGHLSIRLVTFNDANGGKSPSAACQRTPVSLSRHDIPVRAGRVLPVIASLAAALAAALAVVDKKSLYSELLIALPWLTGVIVFLSLLIGFRGKGDS